MSGSRYLEGEGNKPKMMREGGDKILLITNKKHTEITQVFSKGWQQSPVFLTWRFWSS